jgi:hypothetical protein
MNVDEGEWSVEQGTVRYKLRRGSTDGGADCDGVGEQGCERGRGSSRRKRGKGLGRIL